MLALSEKDRKRGLVLAVGGLGGLVMLDETILGVSLPAIRSEFGMSATTAHWIINSYMLAFTCFAAIGGKAIDLFGLRPAMIVSCSVFAAASLLAGLADNTAMLIAMRVVQGLCAAIMFPMTLAAATLTFDQEERGRAIGILAGMATIFLAIGPMLGGILTDFLSWRWVFWINIPIVVAGGVFACLLWKKPEKELKRPVIDRIGLVLLLIGMTSLIFGLMEGPDFGWASPAILGTLVVGIVGLTVFVGYEARQSKPLIDVRLFKLKPFHASALVILLSQMSKIIVAIFIPHFLQLEMGFSALWAGIGTAVGVLPFPFLAAFAGRYADKAGARKPVLVSMALLALSCGLIAATLVFKNYWLLAPMLFLWGATLPYSMIPTGRITVNAVPLEKQGEVSGLIITCRLVGGTLGVTLGSVLLAMHTSFSSIFWTLAVMIAACFAYCLVALDKDAPASS
ncbi:DHA2 family efflux MFS transporter permease subunit [Roseibium sp. SCPC15]|uniref:DHA2 family efflux MFS transporter permease subunit n=1 Tax=Roseibium sp. SCP15 TaxID=3141376 RepID=UPI00333D6459